MDLADLGYLADDDDDEEYACIGSVATETRYLGYGDVVHLSIAISSGVLWYLDGILKARMLLISNDTASRSLAKEIILTLQRSVFALVSDVNMAVLA